MADQTSLLKILITAQNQTNAAFSQMNRDLSNLRQQVVGVVSALAGGLAFKDIIDSTRTWGSEVDRLQDELGGTAEEMSKLNFIAQSVGLTTDDVSTTFGLLNKRIVDSADEIAKGTSVFDKFNIKLMDANGNIAIGGGALAIIKKRFQELGQGAQGTALLLDVFGRSGKALSDFLALTDPEMAKMVKDVEEFGGVLSQAQSDSIEQFNRSLARLNLQFTLLKLQIGQALLPLLSALIGTVSKFVGRVKELGEAIGRMLGPLKQWVDQHGGIKAVADALLTIGVALAGLAAVGALVALIKLIGGLVLAAVPLALVAGGLLLVVGAIIGLNDALTNIQDPGKKIQTILGDLGVAFAGLALILLPFAPVAALVAATIALVFFAVRELGETVLVLKNNWDKMGEALRRGDLTKLLGELPGPLGIAGTAFGLFAQAIQAALNVYQALQRALAGGNGGVDFPGGGGFDVGDSGSQPRLFASGGIVTRPTLGIVGESGPEAVVPLSRGVGGAGGTTINVNVGGSVISERELADTLSDVVLRRLFSQRNLSF